MTQQEQIFIAFLEGVCKKFNCAEAAAPLSDGFKAFCEAMESEPFETWANKQPWTSEYDQVIPPKEDPADGFQSLSKYYIVRRGDKYNVVRAYVAGLNEPTKASPISEVWFDQVAQAGQTPFNNKPKYVVQRGPATLMMDCLGCLSDKDISFGKPTSEDDFWDRLRKKGYHGWDDHVWDRLFKKGYHA